MATSDIHMLLRVGTSQVPEGLSVSQIFGQPIHGAQSLWEKPERKFVVHS